MAPTVFLSMYGCSLGELQKIRHEILSGLTSWRHKSCIYLSTGYRITHDIMSHVCTRYSIQNISISTKACLPAGSICWQKQAQNPRRDTSIPCVSAGLNTAGDQGDKLGNDFVLHKKCQLILLRIYQLNNIFFSSALLCVCDCIIIKCLFGQNI